MFFIFSIFKTTKPVYFKTTFFVCYLFFRYYTKARVVLHQYQHMSSFHDIQQDCEVIVKELRDCLKDHFRDPKVMVV